MSLAKSDQRFDGVAAIIIFVRIENICSHLQSAMQKRARKCNPRPRNVINFGAIPRNCDLNTLRLWVLPVPFSPQPVWLQRASHP